jgi:hypothetical protein
VGPRSVLDAVVKRNFPAPTGNRTLDSEYTVFFDRVGDSWLFQDPVTAAEVVKCRMRREYDSKM